MAGQERQGTNLFIDFFAFIGRPLLLLLKLLLKIAFYFLFLFWQTRSWPVKIYRYFYQKTSKRFFKNLFSFIGGKVALLKKEAGKRSFQRPVKLSFFKVPFRLRLRLLLLLVSLLLLAYFSWSIFKDLPQPQKLITRNIKQTTRIYDRNGNLLYKVFRHQNRTVVPLEEIPLVVKEATIAIEDGNFYQHRGISISGIARAFWRLVLERRVEGGSTITQQLVKNALLSQERTMARKLKEIVLALMVETSFSKDQILQMYFNEVSYGGAIYGIEEASQYYFGKSAQDLNLSEAAFLAGLPASPTTYSPFGAYPQLAKIRQEEVLLQMEKRGFITPEASQRAKKEEIRLTTIKQDILAPHFVMQVKQELVSIFNTQFVEEGGLQVTTTLDLATQQMAEKIVQEELDKLVNYRVTNGAALVTNPGTGEILAMVGSRDYIDQDNDGNFNVVIAPRQPGSTIKVVNYALALQNGYTLASRILDGPVSYQLPGQPPYQPTNYDNRFHGLMTLRTALACSYNVPAVKVLASLGVDRMIELGRRMGIESWSDDNYYGLSLTLGGGEVTMKDLATVYGVLANEGMKAPLQTIVKVHDRKGRLIWSNPCLEGAKINPNTFAVQAKVDHSSCRQEVVSSQIAFLLTSVLSDNQARTPVFGANSIINIPGFQVAVKTGTTNNLRDNWTIGYTPNVLVAAWVGNNDNSPMARIASGITGASPIWRKIMEKLIIQETQKEFSIPEGITTQTVCFSWDEKKQACQRATVEYFISGTESKIEDQKVEPDTREKLLPGRQDSKEEN
ncbi:MAG: PBP1A family penicillin-binding protein [Candidatus Shapirobacteria bacterium]|nr:PBP1A family penicillin-binding protein [Candidatus Shapirobacteria bacterium]